MGALLALYLVLVGQRAVSFLASGSAVGIGIGVALALLAVLGAWALVREFRFGAAANRLVRRLAAEEPLPFADLPRRPSGRVDRGAADRRFDTYREAAEARPDDWRAWLRLGLAYDASGDRRRARAAVRRAISLGPAR
ncbi:hypothetical protein QDR37_13730 [Amnibacterium sp. CER49]|uniref:hypothetical protein n=1 Tax=Amnibacterium sp. CER49 TaxID=3039161 RepID=UPI0024494069|nr:hypothetical protein [Amnibacterium sp. CER49]MDH2445009.1 hypothetical protein [Amnibacterium sp. CER49]